jgi:hypothetical protein
LRDREFFNGDGYPDELLDSVLEDVVQELRAPVETSGKFEDRVMSAVRATPVREFQFPRWRRDSIRLSPAAALALAAGIAFIAFIGGRNVDDDSAEAVSVQAPAPAQTIRFVYVDRSAREVALVGDFNHWQKGATRLEPTGIPGVWAVSVALPAGMHEYAFVVDGERWSADPLAPGVTDEFGTESSIVRVQGPTSS